MWRELQLGAVDFAEERVLENPRTVENLARCWRLCGAGNSARSRLSAGSGRLKGGCGQDWPPHTAGFSSLFVGRRPILTGQEDCPT
jgi:hypothetical protein